MKSQNIDKLDQDTLDIIAWALKNHVVGWDMCHAVEVRLDDPMTHMLKGGDGVVMHGGGDSRRYLKHLGDNDWAVVHHADEDWNLLPLDEMERRASEILNQV
jgi:hypothetical protein